MRLAGPIVIVSVLLWLFQFRSHSAPVIIGPNLDKSLRPRVDIVACKRTSQQLGSRDAIQFGIFKQDRVTKHVSNSFW